jgi:hypothetical protein
MTPAEVNRFDKLYQRHLRLLKLQGKSQKTIDAYSRAVRRISEHFDCCPDQLIPEQLEVYFGNLVDTHSWSIVKTARRLPAEVRAGDLLTLFELNQAFPD